MYVVVEEGGGADAEEAPLPHLEAPKPLLPQIAVEVQLEKQLARGVLGHLLDVLGTQGQDVPPVDDHLLEGGDVVRGVLEAKVVKEGALQRGDDRETPPLQDIAVHSGQRPFLAHLQRTRVKRAKYSSPDRFCQLGRGHNHMEVPRIIYLEGLSDGNGQEGVRAYALANSAHNQPS